MGERRGWNEADIALMASQSADDFERIFETLRGDDLKSSISILLMIGKNPNLDELGMILTTATAALRRITAKSPVRAGKGQWLFRRDP